MERIGKVFKKGVRDVEGMRIVDGYVRSKNLKNIVRSIDFLDCVTDKIGENAEAAIKHWPERKIDQGDCWGLLVEETEGMTYFTYSFAYDSKLHEDEIKVTVMKPETPEVEKKAKKDDKDDKKKPKGKGQGKKPAPKIFVKKRKAKEEKKDVQTLRKEKYTEGVKDFLRRQALKIQHMMYVYFPMQAQQMYAGAMA